MMLFDTPLPSIYDNVSLDDDVKFLFDLGKFANWFSGSDIDVESLPYDELRTMGDTARWEFALQIAKAHGTLPPDTSTDHIRRVVEAAMSHAKMIHDYQIVPLSSGASGAARAARRPQPDDRTDAGPGSGLGRRYR